MFSNQKLYTTAILGCVLFTACKLPVTLKKEQHNLLPAAYSNMPADSSNTAALHWKDYFTDPYLQALIDTALQHNQELNITMQEVMISRNEIRARKGEYLPFVGIKGAAGVEKTARYTSKGASDATTEIMPGKEMPDPLPDYLLGVYAQWEADIWGKLHNARRAAAARYLATTEGRNFLVTNLVAEIANSYYELLSLDNQLDIVQQNIGVQTNALRIVRMQKDAAKVTELAVKRFEAQVLHTQGMQYEIRQKITETENRINYLLGRYPQPIARSSAPLDQILPAAVHAGIPAQLLDNRPDIRQAAQELKAAGLDVQVAKANFYPSLGISASAGYQAFNPSWLLKTPESVLYGLAGDLVAPLVNRNAIKAQYASANARQVQAVYHYEQTVLNAYTEVLNQLSMIGNLQQTYDLKTKEVAALNESVTVSNGLFNSARADYMEVLLTQRDALESKFELVETKKQQLNATVNIYRALGGGWN